MKLWSRLMARMWKPEDEKRLRPGPPASHPLDPRVHAAILRALERSRQARTVIGEDAGRMKRAGEALARGVTTGNLVVH